MTGTAAAVLPQPAATAARITTNASQSFTKDLSTSRYVGMSDQRGGRLSQERPRYAGRGCQLRRPHGGLPGCAARGDPLILANRRWRLRMWLSILGLCGAS